MYADFVKNEYASDVLLFNFEKKKLELLAYRAYSRILFQTGRKLEVYEILKEQIDFYESLRDKNDYEVLILENKLKEYVDTNQILPDLYHQILNLLAYLKDFSNFKNFL